MTQDRRNDQWRSSSTRSDRSGDRHGFRRGGDDDRRQPAYDRDGRRHGSGHRGRSGSFSDQDAPGGGYSRDDRRRAPRRENDGRRGSFRRGDRSSGWDGKRRENGRGGAR